MKKDICDGKKKAENDIKAIAEIIKVFLVRHAVTEQNKMRDKLCGIKSKTKIVVERLRRETTASPSNI